ncbi:MAG: GerMN domain-containing protein [Blautia sp.]|nr:GerMN domain-containing protein [Blautia sp.]MCM1199781.1 GerMN domain-containing protein [Bacteroides fragilis]
MKNRKLIAVIFVMIVLTLAACGNAAEDVPAIEENADAEASANDLLVNSLEYLLNEEGVPPIPEGQAPEGEDRRPEKEETAAQAEVTIYYGNGASNMLSSEMTAMEQVTAENLIDALLKHNIVSLGTKVNSFEEEEAGGIKKLRLDLSRTFREYLKTMTQEGEKIIISSVAATFLEAYDAEEIVITVDGKVLETDHTSYEEPIRLSSEAFAAPLSE